VIVGLAMWATSLIARPWEIPATARFILIAAFFLFAGVFAAPAFIAFRRAETTIDPVRIDRASALVTTGIYRLTRNPMYVGLTALLCSWAVYLAVPWAFLGPVFFILFMTRFQIIPEERTMETKFGRAYADYKRRVRRWL
jgi:protein-S-isoprenylcysteine O-methyltransferase Ste14